MLDGAGTSLREYIYWGNQQIALISNGTTYYVHNDHLNTPQVITNQNQQVVWMGDYEPFGKVASNPNNNIEIFSRFPGQYLDSETGLYYNYFRDYDPSIGRYIESDPIGLDGGINTYAYVGGNPLKFIDFLGLSTADINIIINQLNNQFSDLNSGGNWQFGDPSSGAAASTRPWNGQMIFPNSWNSPGCLSFGDYASRIETIFHEMMHSSDPWYTRWTTGPEAIDSHHQSIGNRSNWELGIIVHGAQPDLNMWGMPRPSDARVDKKKLYEDYKNMNPDCGCKNE